MIAFIENICKPTEGFNHCFLETYGYSKFLSKIMKTVSIYTNQSQL